MHMRKAGRTVGMLARTLIARTAIVAATLALIVGAVGCGSGDDSATGSTEGKQAAEERLPADVKKAAAAAALKLTNGERLGGKVDLFGVVTGPQGDAIEASLKPFEEATGIDVNYQATFSQQSILQTRVQAGNPPDLVLSAYPVQLIDLAEQGRLIPLDDVLDMPSVTERFPRALLDLGTVEGELYAYFPIVNYHGLVWYNPAAYDGPQRPQTWDELESWVDTSAADGKPAWCLGIESGPATGWPAANEVLEMLFLRRYGPELTTQWVEGTLPWTSEEVRWAWEAFGDTFTDPRKVAGGPVKVATTNFLQAGNGMFTKPSTCSLLPQGQWYGGYALSAVRGAREDGVEYFAFPSITEEYADHRMVDGNQVAMLKDTPQGRAVVQYMASTEFATLLAKSGQFTVPDANVPAKAYPTPLQRKQAEDLVKSAAAKESTILLPSALFPVPVVEQLNKNLTSYLQHPDRLDDYLSDLDEVAQKASS